MLYKYVDVCICTNLSHIKMLWLHICVCVHMYALCGTSLSHMLTYRVVCTLDLLSGHATFSTSKSGKEPSPQTSHKATLIVKRLCKLFPTVITTPSTDKVIDLDFTPDPSCYSISSTLTPASSGAKLTPCSFRFKLMVLSPSQWVRQPFHRVPFTSSVLANGSGVTAESYKDPTYSIFATFPEEDQVMDLLELSEKEKLIEFHVSTLKAYAAVSSHCNKSIARKVGAILDPEQLLQCLKMRGMHFSLRATYIELFNTLHLDPEVHCKLMTRGEFILPLSSCSNPVPLSLPGMELSPQGCDQAVSNQARAAHNVKSCLSCNSEGGSGGGECRLNFSVKELKEMVFYNLEKLVCTR